MGSTNQRWQALLLQSKPDLQNSYEITWNRLHLEQTANRFMGFLKRVGTGKCCRTAGSGGKAHLRVPPLVLPMQLPPFATVASPLLAGPAGCCSGLLVSLRPAFRTASRDSFNARTPTLCSRSCQMQDVARLGVAGKWLMLALAAPEKLRAPLQGQKLESPECFGDAAHRWQHHPCEDPRQLKPGRVAACGSADAPDRKVPKQTGALHQI